MIPFIHPDKPESLPKENEEVFLAIYIATFLASSAAIHYAAGKTADEIKNTQPVEDAFELASKAWDHVNDPPLDDFDFEDNFEDRD